MAIRNARFRAQGNVVFGQAANKPFDTITND